MTCFNLLLMLLMQTQQFIHVELLSSSFLHNLHFHSANSIIVNLSFINYGMVEWVN